MLVVEPYDTDKSLIPINDAMRNHVIPAHPFSMLVCGTSGSGKTQMVLNLLKKPRLYGGYFDVTYIFSQTAAAGDDLYAKHSGVPERDIFKPDAEGIAQLQHIMKKQQTTIKSRGIAASPKILVLFDDIAHARKFLDSPEYLQMHILNRHLNISTWSLTQSYVKIPRSARSQVGAVAFFHGATATEKVRLADEHTPAGFTPDEFEQLINYAIARKHDFLFINKQDDHASRYRHCLHTILRITPRDGAAPEEPRVDVEQVAECPPEEAKKEPRREPTHEERVRANWF